MGDDVSEWQPEVWRPVTGWDDYYEVSDHGRVRKLGGDEVGQWPNDQGYMYVRLANPRCMARVHRLVAKAFVPNSEELPTVNHLDHNRANNRASNIEWCDQQRNISHAHAAGRMYRHPKGAPFPRRKG